MNRVTSVPRVVVFAAGLVGLVVLAVASGQAHAQVTPQQKQEARQHYERATRAYDVGKYKDAIEEYQKAYEIGGDPPMLYNIAQAYRLSDQPAEAVRYYRRYLQRQPNARNREDVERRIADMEKLIQERGKAQSPAPGGTTPAPGTGPGGAPASTSPPGNAPPVVPPAPPPPGITAPPPSTPPSVAPAPRSELRVLKIVGWSLVGVGAVLGGVGAYQAVVASDKADKITGESMQDPPLVFDPAVEENGKNASFRAVLLGSLGAAAIVGGVVALVLDGISGSSETSARPAGGARAALVPALTPMVGAGGGVVVAGAGLRF